MAPESDAPKAEADARLRPTKEDSMEVTACLRCGRVAEDLIHDEPNDHGWTGTGAMHRFIDARGKRLVQQCAWEIALRGKAGQKGGALTPDQVRWNDAIHEAETSVNALFAPFSAEELAEHDHYWKDEYTKQAASVAYAARIARAALTAAVLTMPDEAFGWLVLAMAPAAMTHGANAQIWPDGIGGFTQASKDAITAVRAAAAAWQKAQA